MKLTTLDLKNRDYGILQNNPYNKCCSISKPIIIEFIDDYFGGELEVGIIGNDIMYGSAKFSSFNINDYFLNKYINFLCNSVDYTIDKYIKDLSKDLNIKYKDILTNKMDNYNKKRIICYVFESILFSFGCIIKVRINENLIDFIEFESF